MFSYYYLIQESCCYVTANYIDNNYYNSTKRTPTLHTSRVNPNLLLCYYMYAPAYDLVVALVLLFPPLNSQISKVIIFKF